MGCWDSLVVDPGGVGETSTDLEVGVVWVLFKHPAPPRFLSLSLDRSRTGGDSVPVTVHSVRDRSQREGRDGSGTAS